jgi:hypothetical protein
MAISLYEASIPTYMQTLGAVEGFLAKALAHFRETGVDPAEIVETRLYPDMHPFRYQVQSVVAHSRGAIEAIKKGSFEIWANRPAHDYAGLQAFIRLTREAMTKTLPDEIDELAGREVVFELPHARRVFTAEGFLLSFSIPNLHFHATTAYDILRMKGVPLGKRDYMGELQLKG